VTKFLCFLSFLGQKDEEEILKFGSTSQKDFSQKFTILLKFIRRCVYLSTASFLVLCCLYATSNGEFFSGSP
jgi:hypothetical protein